MRTLFTITLFLSSVLLFLVEPMIAKMILPRFGGSPGVWNTSMLFFQIALLAGYGYAHVATKAMGPRIQAITHVVVLLLPILTLPFTLPAWIHSGAGDPAPLVLLILTISVGAPFLVVSAGAPLLQRWFAATDDPHAKDPYFLYSASNLGSMLALLAYPFLIEPQFSLSVQAHLWSYGYFSLVLLMAVCAGALWLSHGKGSVVHEAPATLPPEGERETTEAKTVVTSRDRLRWIALAFCPSSLLLGVTTYLTSNIAPVPLLWVVPLALYLATFIVAFARKRVLSSAALSRVFPLVTIPLAFAIVLESSEPQLIVPLVVLHLLVFFTAGLLCHTELAEDRPGAEHLTEFFFYVSLGGVLGGLFNAIIAPTVFNTFFEYPLVLALVAFFMRARTETRFARMDWIYPLAFGIVTAVMIFFAKQAMPEATNLRSLLTIGIPLVLVFLAVDRPVRFACTLGVFFIVASIMQVSASSRIIAGKRSFFGVHRIDSYTNQFGSFHGLLHGNTVHGKENFEHPDEPLTYYHPSGPIGQVFRTLGPSRHDVALVGLGVGSLATYGRPGQRFTYYEIDPDVVQIASDRKFFTFLSDCKADLHIQVGDARLELAKAPAASYDLIVLDAFSSDSIPMHLLTREAIEMYLSKLAPGGVLAFHISNRYLDLGPVLGNEASAVKLAAWIEEDLIKGPDDNLKGITPSTWVVMARQESDFGELSRRFPGWDPLGADPRYPVWTDDYSNIASVLKIFRKSEE